MVAAQAARLMSEAQAELAQQKYEGLSDQANQPKGNNDTNAQSNSNPVYTSKSLDQFQSVAANAVQSRCVPPCVFNRLAS